MTDNTHAQPVDLKPCPWCGCDAWIIEDRGDHGTEPLLYRPQCKMCGASRGGYTYRDNAAAAWNVLAELEAARRPTSAVVEVCPDCDIANCRHIRERDGYAAIHREQLARPSLNGRRHTSDVLQPPAPETEGDWVMVPREPTEAMMDAGLYQSSHDSEYGDVHSIWKDMVSAAPAMLSKAPSPPLGDLGGPARADLSRASPSPTRRQTGVCRVDFEPDGLALDDLAITGDQIEMLRLERMNSGDMWGNVSLLDGRDLRLSFHAEKKDRLDAIAEWEGRTTPDLTSPAPRHDDGGAA